MRCRRASAAGEWLGRRCTLARRTSTTPEVLGALEVVLDRRGLLDVRLSVGDGRRVAGYAGCPRSTRRRSRAPITMSPIENCWLGAREGHDVAQEHEQCRRPPAGA